MKMFYLSLLLPIAFVGCANDYPIHKIPDKHTAVLDEGAVKGEGVRVVNHRYNPRYRNFDYDRLGYISNNGLYYGYYDDVGYFYNDVYYPYDDRYRYDDRVYHRGYFSPSYIRVNRPKFRVYHPIEYGPSYQKR